jgi:uncharacterized protein (DUF2062 family)
VSLFGPGLRERARALLHLDDPPWKLAAALALGVFISFTPLLGVQTVLALLLATVLRLNRAATVTGTWINLPWFMPFVYAAALWLGELIVARAPGHWLLPLLVGSTILGAAAAVLTWLLAFGVMTWRMRRARRAPAGHGGPA